MTTAGGKVRAKNGGDWSFLGVIAAGLGLLFTCCPLKISIISLFLMPAGITGITIGLLRGESKRGLAPLRALFIGIVAVGAVALPLSLYGLVVRHFDRGDYLGFYGTHVEATVDTTKCKW